MICMTAKSSSLSSSGSNGTRDIVNTLESYRDVCGMHRTSCMSVANVRGKIVNLLQLRIESKERSCHFSDEVEFTRPLTKF